MNQTTLSDYFNFPQSAAMAENIIGSRINNRLRSLALHEQTDKLQKDQALQNVLRSYYGGGQPSPNGGGTLLPAPMATNAPPVSGGGGMNYMGTRPPAPGGWLSGNLMSDLGRIDPNIPYAADQARMKLEQDQKKLLVTKLLDQAKEAAKKGNNEEYHQAYNAVRSIIPDAPDMSKMVIGPKPGTMTTVVEIKNGVMPGGKPLIDPLTKMPVKDGMYSVKGEQSEQGLKFTSVIPYNKPETPEDRSRITRENIKFGVDYRNAHPDTSAGIRGIAYNMSKLYDMFDNDTGKPVKVMGKTIVDAPEGRYTPLSGAIGFAADKAQALSEARQRGGTRAAELSDVSNTFNAETPELIALRQKVADKGLLPDTKFKDWNALRQWYETKTSDEDVNELKGRVMLLSEQLQRSIGKGGGEWSFKVTSDLIDPTLSPSAFERRLKAHGNDLKRILSSRRGFGKDSKKATPSVGTEFETLPDPASMAGVILSDGKGGYIKSDGTKWNKVN